MNITVCCPSYKRPKVKTLKYLPFCRVYVDQSEYRAYRKENPDAKIIRCAKGIQGNVARVRNYILDQEFASGANAVAIVDDDMQGMFYYEGSKKVHKLPTSEFMDFLEKYTIMAQDIGAFLWGVNVNPDPQSYRECGPFSTLSFIGGPFGCFLRGNTCRYDERLPLKEDYDMVIQQLNTNRLVFRVNKFYYQVKQSKQAGGCAAVRNFKYEREQLELLRAKWGDRIVKYDTLNRNHKTTKNRGVTFDYNPVIRVPIKGI